MIAIKERPILFNSEMVRAVLGGRYVKTQTRRVIKRQPEGEVTHCGNVEGDFWAMYVAGKEINQTLVFRCPYGKPGDELWVRETMWRNGGYVATDAPNFKNEGKVPSIFMRKIDSRIQLVITDIRVETVQDISQEDAGAEGCPLICWPDDVHKPRTFGFKELWDSINEKRGFGWITNPWVWVVKFELLKQK